MSEKVKKKKRILTLITRKLVLVVGIACAVSVVLTYFLLSNRSKKDALNYVTQNAVDMIEYAYNLTSMRDLDSTVEEFGQRILSVDDMDTDDLKEFEDAERELSIIRTDGVITASSIPEVVGENVLEGDSENFATASEMLQELLNDIKECEARGLDMDTTLLYSCRNMEDHTSLDGKRKLRYIGFVIRDGSGVILYGISNDLFYDYYYRDLEDVISTRKVGQGGYAIVIEEGMTQIAGNNGHDNDEFRKDFAYPDIIAEVDNSQAYKTINPDKEQNVEFPIYYVNGIENIYGVMSYYSVFKVADRYVMALYPKSEAEESMNTTIIYTVIMELLVFSVLLAVIFLLEKRIVIKDILRVNTTLNSITQGNLEARADVRGSYEFNTLSDDINATVDKLKGLIKEAEERMDADLAIAREIQVSSLPNVFPPFPDRKQFELFASMQAAKEVGGDFYDFFMIGVDTLGFLIADVSGKSVPGAMFMMRGKSVIKSLAESGMPPADVFSVANEKLSEGNDAEMFLTAWLGYLDIRSGEVHVANAGHNPPVLIRDGKAEYVVLKPGLMLAGMEGTIYREQIVRFKKHDILFLYTDGVTEAMNADEEMYGEDRLLELLSFGDSYPEPTGENGIAGAVCELVKEDVASFVNGTEQSDDITMLCVRYLGDEIK